MTIAERRRSFPGSDSGAVTVDWTVLAASVVGLGVASVGVVRGGVGALGADIRSSLSSAMIAFPNLLTGGIFAPDDRFHLHGTYTVMGQTAEWYSTRGLVPGWEVLSDHDWRIDFIGGSAFFGVTNPSGNPMLEMTGGNGEHLSMQQQIQANTGQVYTLSFAAAVPPSPAPHASNNAELEIWWGNTLIDRVRAPQSDTLQSFSYQIVGGAGDGSNMLRLTHTGGDNPGGTYIADIVVN